MVGRKEGECNKNSVTIRGKHDLCSPTSCIVTRITARCLGFGAASCRWSAIYRGSSRLASFLRRNGIRFSLYGLFKIGFRYRKLVAIFRPPHVQGRQQKDAQEQGTN